MSLREDMRIYLDSSLRAAQKRNYLLYRLSKPGEVLKYKPLTLSIVATDRCTLNCDMCPTHSAKVPRDYIFNQAPTKDMPLETFKKITDIFSEALNVQIIGSGEPLLNKDFFAMVEYAAKYRHMKVRTFSNGTTIKLNIDNILSSYLDGITISLNGHNKDEYARMTGASTEFYGIIYDGIKELIAERNKKRSKIKVKVSFVIDKANYKYAGDMIKTALGIGADSIFLCNFLPAPFPGLRHNERTILSDDQDIILFLRNEMEHLNHEAKKKVSFPRIVDTLTQKNACNAHFTQLRIDGEGRVSSCSVMLLNMEGKGFFYDKDVWNNVFFRDMRKAFLENDNALLNGPCRVCPDNKGIDINA